MSTASLLQRAGGGRGFGEVMKEGGSRFWELLLLAGVTSVTAFMLSARSTHGASTRWKRRINHHRCTPQKALAPDSERAKVSFGRRL